MMIKMVKKEINLKKTAAYVKLNLVYFHNLLNQSSHSNNIVEKNQKELNCNIIQDSYD